MAEHKTLYRKWRPDNFSSVVGQNHITDVLKYQVANQKTSHAYLFCGSRGTGKTTCAKILSKAINCLSPINGDPCGVCECCKMIEAGTDTDIIEMDAASNNGVDYIRDIRDEVVYTPAFLKKKVYIIDEVHMLSPGAFNALLKTLEEPPAHVVFILATTELQKLPATITSRCQRFDFKRITTDDIASRLEFIAQKENISITHEACKLIGKIAQGGMRDAISLLELCSGSGKSISVSLVNETAGIMGRDKSVSAVKYILKKDIPSIFELVSEIISSSSDISLFYGELIQFYRDMLVIKHVKNSKDYLDLTSEEYSVTSELSEHFSSERLIYHIKSLEATHNMMQRNSSIKRISAEMGLITLIDDKMANSNDALLSRVASLEEKLASGNFTPLPRPATNKSEKATEDTAKKTPLKTTVDTPKASLLQYWSEVIQTVERTDPGSSGHLKSSKAYFDGSTVTIHLATEFAIMLLDNINTKSLIASGINLNDDSLSITPNNIKFIVDKAVTDESDPFDLF